MFSLILTLFVIPAMYSYLSSKKKRNELEVIEELEKEAGQAQLTH
jgi:multidrug efflux pump